jgi:hypothetical protein
MAEDGVLLKLAVQPVRRRPASAYLPPSTGPVPAHHSSAAALAVPERPSALTVCAVRCAMVATQRVVVTAASAVMVAAGCLYSQRSAAAEEAAKDAAIAAADPYRNQAAAAAAAGKRPQYRLYTMASIPSWNLPTYHPASLKVQAYMRFLKPDEPWFETDASSERRRRTAHCALRTAHCALRTAHCAVILHASVWLSI